MSNATPEWATSLPDDQKALPFVQQTPDLPTLVKRFADLDSYKGRSVALPKEGDADSEKAFEAAVTKRGFIRGEVPADPSGYDVEVDTAALGLDAEWKAGRLKEFHGLGLTKGQAKAALTREVESMTGALQKIRAEHGDGGIEAIKRASERYNIGNDPTAVLSLLRELGATMTEETTKVGGGAPAGMSVQEIDAQIAGLDEEILKLPDYDPRSDVLLQKKFALMMQKSGQANSGLTLDKVTLGR
jgi:hypothetical protein